MKNTLAVPTTNQYLEQALCILQDGIVILNREREIVYINQAAADIFSECLQVVPVPGDDFISPICDERKSAVQARMDTAFDNRSIEVDYNEDKPDSSNWFRIGYYPMPDEEGAITHVCMRVRNITEKIMLERELEQQQRKQKNNILKAALHAQEKERAEIGKELHDHVNQVLTTVKLYNEICLTEEKTNKHLLMRSVQQINHCIEALRSLSQSLVSPEAGTVSLKESIRELVDSIVQTQRLDVKFFTYGLHEERLRQDVHTAIYRIAQEQLTNVLKYARASSVEVLLVGTAETVALRIQDNGCGYDMKRKRKGTGLTNIISRVEALDGQIDINTSPGEGFVLMAEFPV